MWKLDNTMSTQQNSIDSHIDKGLKRVLTKGWVYKLFSNIVAKKDSRMRIVKEYIKPFPGCRILDIGCGPADIISYLPDSIGEYVGFDMNPDYIESAILHWSDRTRFKFFCQKVEEATISKTEYYDIVLALGVVHHLDDNRALRLFDIAYKTLRPDGILITYDNVFIENQNWFAKWFISKDRGNAVRTVEGYKKLATNYFVDIESTVLHDMLRIPYTIFIMKCQK